MDSELITNSNCNARRQVCAPYGAIPVEHASERAGLTPRCAIAVQRCRCDGVGPGALADGVGQRLEASPARQRIWQPWQPEERHIPASAALLGVGPHRLAPNRGVRRIQEYELFEALSMAGRDPPADKPSPIMAHNREATLPKMICKTENIDRQRVEIVGRDF